jgi:hypothetical protein
MSVTCESVKIRPRGPGFGPPLRGELRDYGYDSVQVSGVRCQRDAKWIIGNPVSFIDIFCNDSLSENKAEETPECFIFGIKSLFDSGVLEYPAYLFHYFKRSNKLKFLVYPYDIVVLVMDRNDICEIE